MNEQERQEFERKIAEAVEKSKARGVPQEPEEVHRQCLNPDCNKIIAGPHTGAQPGYRTHHITEQGEILTDEEMDRRGLEDNVSHGYCHEGECVDQMRERRKRDYAEYKRKQAERAAQATPPAPPMAPNPPIVNPAPMPRIRRRIEKRPR